jgi:hypothetical protein
MHVSTSVGQLQNPATKHLALSSRSASAAIASTLNRLADLFGRAVRGGVRAFTSAYTRSFEEKEEGRVLPS